MTGIAHDSRQVAAGGLFVAIRGLMVDGHSFIERALGAGAAAVLVQEDARETWAPFAGRGACFVAAPDARVALAEAAAGFYGHPARVLGTVGVTGTDGKTTTSHLIAHVLTATGRPCGLLSSVEFAAGGRHELNLSHMTTLEATEVQRQLAQVRDSGDRYAAIEASSIGLEMHRVDQCEFDVAVFTNLTPDHLDYHGTMEAYRDAKALLFGMLDASMDKGFEKCAVLNADDPASEAMGAATRARRLMYGIGASAEVVAHDITLDADGTSFEVSGRGGRVAARTPLLGTYNVANCLAAVGVALSQGASLQDAAAALASFPGVPGRMERIDEGQPFTVIVDIASTEQAMRNVLTVLRAATAGRLIAVFGAAGERDVERRAGLARAVAGGADRAIVTNEDPRSEDPDAIIRDITRALDSAGFSAYEGIADRREAIARAFAIASGGDTVLLAGKATEPSIVIGSTHVPWDERAVARELLRGAKGV